MLALAGAIGLGGAVVYAVTPLRQRALGIWAGATLLFVIASLHILAALKHGFFDKDGVLQRMLPVFGMANGKT